LVGWENFEIDERIEEIRAIANVSEVTGVSRHFARRIEESIHLADQVSWEIKKDPLGEIVRANDAKDHYKALSLACTVFHYTGKQMLFRRTTAVTKNIGFYKTTNALRSRKIIGKTVYDQMENPRKLRNLFQHEDRALNFSSKQAAMAEQTVDKALNCVKILMKKFDNMVKRGRIR
jgi:hypothetical protein